MCIIFWSLDHPHYDLILASNRDEFLGRPTLPAAWHRFSTGSSAARSSDVPTDDLPILSARDASGGGTWLGITRNGAFSSLTNLTETAPPLPEGLASFRSRGELVRDWLLQAVEANPTVTPAASNIPVSSASESRRAIEGFLSGVADTLDHYPGFNLMVGSVASDATVTGYTTNRTADGDILVGRKPDLFASSSRQPPGHTGSALLGPPGITCLGCDGPGASMGLDEVVGMSNSVLEGAWKKVETGKVLFRDALARFTCPADTDPDRQGQSQEAERQLIEDLFDVLWTPPDSPLQGRADLRKTILVPPLQTPNSAGPEWYATRTSTVILVRRPARHETAKSATFVERDVFQLDPTSRQPVRVCGESGQCGRDGSQRRYSWSIQP